MDLPALRAFVKVVQLGSFTRAAEALGSQKAHLSRVVSALEASLGVRLLERTTRSLSLTEAGREFHERALAILAAVDDAQQAMQQIHGEPRGTLRLTCGVDFGLLAVSGWVGTYLARHPQVQVDADFTNRVVDLVHEGFDLAVRVGQLADSSLAARRLGALRYGLYAAPAYLAREGLPATPAHLADHALVKFSGGASPGHWTLLRGDERHTQALAPRLRVNSNLAAHAAARQGLGIALLPTLLAAPDAVAAGRAGPRLQRVLPDWHGPEVPVHALFASARYLTPKVRAFIDLAVAEFAREDAAAA